MDKQELLIKLVEMIIATENNAATAKDTTTAPVGHHVLTGEMVIIRARDAGVHFGELVSVNGRHVVLNKSRRMYKWWAAKESTLTAVAKYGLNLKKDSLNIQSEINGQEILDACEILPCSAECVDSFSKVESYNEQ